jgi:hypothetical protein
MPLLGSGLGRHGEQTVRLRLASASLAPYLVRSETGLACTDTVARRSGYVWEAANNACPTGSGKCNT